jgi:hypothetical protein
VVFAFAGWAEAPTGGVKAEAVKKKPASAMALSMGLSCGEVFAHDAGAPTLVNRASRARFG